MSPPYATWLLFRIQGTLGLCSRLLKESAGLLQDVGAAASTNPALQYSIDVADKAGLFVFCISSETSWQFCYNTEELHLTASPKYSHTVTGLCSLSPPVTALTPQRGCKASFQVSENLQILECETEGPGRPEWLGHGSLKGVPFKYGRTRERALHGAGAWAALFTAVAPASDMLMVDTQQRPWVAEEVRPSSTGLSK